MYIYIYVYIKYVYIYIYIHYIWMIYVGKRMEGESYPNRLILAFVSYV